MKLKYILLASLMLAGTVIGQNWSTRYPSNVRYIAGGYSNSRPFFSTLNSALNDVKPYATADNPYVFWLNSDTLQIADWDSVYNEGLEMSDSVYTYYVQTGKIKWAGFDIDTTKGGRGGSASLSIGAMLGETDHYNLERWDSTGLPLSSWQISLATAMNIIDSLFYARTLFSQVSPTYLTISGDSLIITLSSHIFNPDSFYTDDFDSTTYLRTSSDQIKVGSLIFRDGIVSFEGSGPVVGSVMQLPSTFTSLPRGIFSDGSWIYFRKGGVTYKVALLDSTTSTLKLPNSIDYSAFTQTAIDSIKYLITQPRISLDDVSGVTPSVTQNIYTVIKPGWTTEKIYRMTMAGDSITINSGAAGDYLVRFSCVIDNAVTDDFTFQIRKNNVAVHTTRTSGAGVNAYITFSTQHYFVGLVTGDDISLYITNTANNNDPVMTYMTLYMERKSE